MKLKKYNDIDLYNIYTDEQCLQHLDAHINKTTLKHVKQRVFMKTLEELIELSNLIIQHENKKSKQRFIIPDIEEEFAHVLIRLKQLSQYLDKNNISKHINTKLQSINEQLKLNTDG